MWYSVARDSNIDSIQSITKMNWINRMIQNYYIAIEYRLKDKHVLIEERLDCIWAK